MNYLAEENAKEVQIHKKGNGQQRCKSFFFFFLKGKTSLTPLNFDHCCRYPPMFKTSHLSVSKFGFLSLCPFRTENPNEMPILPQSYVSFWERCSFGVRSKIGIAKDFLYGKGKVRKNQTLIHLSESF